ncbi:hypothetical protein PIB30_069564 [Stylosanthes scabra]|uniref:Uncharacterized protein n=1 Tax=Stylosanthes scabra TaxID=79078 RepID=A0ABU6XPI9_9FABA|nr:hypothetical protein [Stylosanthes scabra]
MTLRWDHQASKLQGSALWERIGYNNNIVFRRNNLSNRVVEKFTIMTLYPSKYGSRDPTQDSESTHPYLPLILWTFPPIKNMEIWERMKAAHEDRCFKNYLKAKTIDPLVRLELIQAALWYPEPCEGRGPKFRSVTEMQPSL